MSDRVNFQITRHNVDEPSAICVICTENGLSEDAARFPLDRIIGHLSGAHGLDIELETWPDGDPVILDPTLEPADFAQPFLSDRDPDDETDTEGSVP